MHCDLPFNLTRKMSLGTIIPKRLQRYVFVIFALAVVGLVLTFSHESSPISFSPADTAVEDGDYKWVFDIINQGRPFLSHPLDKYPKGERAKEKFATDKDFVFSKAYLSDLLEVTPEDVEYLKAKHTALVKAILEDNHASFGPVKEDRGIVFVGGGKFSWLSLLVIEQLRILGCSLPVEVFIGTEDEYEHEFCEVVLPKMNARCSVLHKEVPDLSNLLNDVKINGYQFKNLAFLISRFQRILFLDADNVPIVDPSPVFDSKVFRGHGLVVWPDAWARTTHPSFYDIASVEIPHKIVRGPFKGKEVPDYDTAVSFHDLENTLPNPSSESGMILLDKKVHRKTLLLSLYYNLFGPKLYYPLFTQGSAGEGDKETFVAAASVLGNEYYQVKQMFRFIGYHHGGSFHAKALGQADPIIDYENFLNGAHLNEYNDLVKPKHISNDPPVMFMHLSYPKFTPFALLTNDEIVKEGNEHIRMYPSSTEIGHYDFELRLFQLLTGALCKDYNGETQVSETLVGLNLLEFKDKDPATFCPQLIEHTLWLEANPEK